MHIDTPEIFRDTEHYLGNNIEAFDLKLTHGTIVKLEKLLQSYAGHYSLAGAQCTF